MPKGDGRGVAEVVATLGTESSRWHAIDGAAVGDLTAAGEGETGAGSAVQAKNTSEQMKVSTVSGRTRTLCAMTPLVSSN